MEEVTQEPEQAEEVVDQQGADDGQSIDSIFSDALKEKGSTSNDADQADQDDAESQAPLEPEKPKEAAQTAAEKLFAELLISDAQKIPFKTEDEFNQFLERNPKLKEGFLKDADYRRKTAQVAEQRKAFEAEKKQFEEQSKGELEAWGGEKPDQNSLKALGDIWTVFRHASPALNQAINSFVSDIQLIASGKPPVGPLAGQSGQSGINDSQIIGLKREIDQIRRESATKEKKFTEEREREAREKAVEVLDSWEKEMSQKGVKIETDEFAVMAKLGHLIGQKKPNGETYGFDDAYRAALSVLGRMDKLAIKKVFTNSNKLKNNTPRMPTSRAPANAQPEATTLDAIFDEGLRQIKE